jgi:hypothetical protein
MPIFFECSSCSIKYEVADDMAGKTILCRQCEQRGKVPGVVPAGNPARAAALVGTARGQKPPTRRKALEWGLGGAVVGLVGFAMIYYWSHPLPWELKRRPRPTNPAEADAGGPPADGGPGGDPGRRKGGRGGGKRGAQGPLQ